eukprot:7377649-Prymnesium_polylepis.1
MHPHKVERHGRRLSEQLARSGLLDVRLHAAHVVGPVRLDLAVVTRRGRGPLCDARVLRQPMVEVSHSSLVDAEDQECRQAVPAAWVRGLAPARRLAPVVKLLRQRRRRAAEHRRE